MTDHGEPALIANSDGSRPGRWRRRWQRCTAQIRAGNLSASYSDALFTTSNTSDMNIALLQWRMQASKGCSSVRHWVDRAIPLTARWIAKVELVLWENSCRLAINILFTTRQILSPWRRCKFGREKQLACFVWLVAASGLRSGLKTVLFGCRQHPCIVSYECWKNQIKCGFVLG
jgi:hypothetical protein